VRWSIFSFPCRWYQPLSSTIQRNRLCLCSKQGRRQESHTPAHRHAQSKCFSEQAFRCLDFVWLVFKVKSTRAGYLWRTALEGNHLRWLTLANQNTMETFHFHDHPEHIRNTNWHATEPRLWTSTALLLYFYIVKLHHVSQWCVVNISYSRTALVFTLLYPLSTYTSSCTEVLQESIK